MARMHGSQCRVYLGSRDVSADLATVDLKFAAATHDRTTFNDAGWMTFDGGLASWEATIDGFYQTNGAGNVTSIERQFEAFLGATGGILSIYDGSADAVGDKGYLLSDSVLAQMGEPIKVSDLIKLTGSLKPAPGSYSAKAGMFGVLLHPLGAQTTSGNGTAVDNSASSSAGGRGTLHVTAATGSGTVKIQHSADNSSWADLVTFTAATAATSETIEVTGAVNRYLRATWAPGTSITFVCGFARY